MSLKKIFIVTGSRAEFGQLLPLVKELKKISYWDIEIIATGAHVSDKDEISLNEIISNGLNIYEKVILDFSDNTEIGITKQIGSGIEKFGLVFSNESPDLIIIIGDRYEMFAASVAAAVEGFPIAHLCGGSVTEGAIDEFFRHSITKMSSIHFTTCETYRKRVIQLGEQPETVFNVGSLAIENCLNVELLTETELKNDIGLPQKSKYCVITFHPVTHERRSSIKQLEELISALKYFPDFYYIITLSNADAGGDLINKRWKEVGESNKNFKIVKSLGTKRYLSALKYSEMMIGNSSSGTTEGPALKIPTIDIGDRQAGRVKAASIIQANTEKKSIINAIEKALDEEFRTNLQIIPNVFGDGSTSKQIVQLLQEKFLIGFETKKKFYDVDFNYKKK